jgi:acetylornithine deacetylase/succinyl-diaminopimelate desuccinylase-like protein
MTDELASYLDRTREQRLESFKALLRIPSISGIPAHAPDCRAAAEFVAADMRSVGLEHVDVSDTGGHPVVYGDWLGTPGMPTVLVYGHYDVQPVDPLDLWESPPFEPVVRDGRMLARGSSDDKSQIHMHLRAIEALLATDCKLPVNVKVIFEGEEESSSIHLDAWLEANRDRLQADFAVISDTSFFEGNLPSITVSLRGLTYFQLDVFGSPLDLHSGGYGGAVDNPINVLCQIVAALKRPDGRVNVRGFYDDVVEPSPLEREALARLPFDEDAYRESIGVPALIGEPGYTVLERLGMRPTLDVNGIWGGFEGEGPKTIIPAHAHAKISCRLVADQDPEKVFQLVAARIAEITPKTVRYSIQRLGDGRPSAYRSPGHSGGCPSSDGKLRVRAPVHAGRRLRARVRELRIDSRPADRAPRLRATGRPVPCAERVDVDGQLRDRHPRHRQVLGGSGIPRTMAYRRSPLGACIMTSVIAIRQARERLLCSLVRCPKRRRAATMPTVPLRSGWRHQ